MKEKIKGEQPAAFENKDEITKQVKAPPPTDSIPSAKPEKKWPPLEWIKKGVVEVKNTAKKMWEAEKGNNIDFFQATAKYLVFVESVENRLQEIDRLEEKSDDEKAKRIIEEARREGYLFGIDGSSPPKTCQLLQEVLERLNKEASNAGIKETVKRESTAHFQSSLKRDVKAFLAGWQATAERMEEKERERRKERELVDAGVVKRFVRPDRTEEIGLSNGIERRDNRGRNSQK